MAADSQQLYFPNMNKGFLVKSFNLKPCNIGYVNNNILNLNKETLTSSPDVAESGPIPDIGFGIFWLSIINNTYIVYRLYNIAYAT